MDRCRDLGADVVVDYDATDYVEAALAATGGVGVDVVLDVVGGDYVARNIAATKVTGRIVQVGVMGGGRARGPCGRPAAQAHLLDRHGAPRTDPPRRRSP